MRVGDGGNCDAMQWTWATTIQARASMPEGKSTGRGDLPAEVLQGLSNEALWWPSTTIRASGPISWSHNRLYLLPAKMYMAGVMILVKQWADLHLGSAWSGQLFHGFEPRCKCEDLLVTIQAAVQTSAEWPDSLPLVLCNTDVRQAFGFVSPSTVARCLRYWDFPPRMVRGIVRESLFFQAEALCGGVQTTPEFRIAQSIRQGGTESPWCFNLVVRTILVEEGPWLREPGVDIPLIGKTAVLGCADNILFMARRHEGAQRIGRGGDDTPTPMTWQDESGKISSWFPIVGSWDVLSLRILGPWLCIDCLVQARRSWRIELSSVALGSLGRRRSRSS